MNYLIKYICRLKMVLFALIVCTNLYAQHRHFSKIPTQEGDANLSVRQVIQDKQGFLWLATFSGLYRFEGDDYILYHRFRGKDEVNQDVTALLKDQNSNIWIGTNDGLFKYNPETDDLTRFFRNNDEPNSIGTNKIRSLAMDNMGRIWIGTYDMGMYLYDSKNDSFLKISFKEHTRFEPKYVKTIYAGDNSKIWFGTLNNGLYCFSYTNSETHSVLNFREENNDRKLSNNYVLEIFKDTDGTIAVGTRNGLNIFNSELGEFTDVSTEYFMPGSMTNFFRSIIRDRNGMLWIGTWGGLIQCNSFLDIQNGNYQLVTHNRNIPSSISHNQIMDIFQDKSGVIWLATENGINRYDPYFNQFQPLYGDVIDKLREPTATAFSNYKDGMLILTLSDGILFKKEKEVKSFYQKKYPGFESEKCYSLCVDSENNIWAGSNNGVLAKIDNHSRLATSFKHSDESIAIYSIVEFDGVLVIGTAGEGVKYFDPTTNKFQSERGLSANINVNEIFIDSKKQMWVASQFGIFKKEYKSGSFEYYLPDNGDSILNPNIFFDVAESADGKIYIGGRNGLYIYDEVNNEFYNKTFDRSEKLWVTNLQFDSKQNLWLNLNFNKVAKVEANSNNLLVYNVNNGIRTSPYNQRGFFIDKNDKIFISGFDQIFEFDAAHLVKNTYAPQPQLTKLQINNIEIHPGTKLNNQQILERSISYEKKIVLNHLNKDFTISFTSDSYRNAKENKFRFKLHGYDEEWNESKAHSAKYTNLSPGNYTFEVFGANNDGLWSNESASIEIRILPAPLLSTFAFILYFIILCVSAFFLRRILVARIRLKRELLIEKVKRDKEEKFNKERLQFYTNISHELRTPLTLIMGPAKELIAGDKPNSTNAKLHQLILNNSQRLLSLVNQLLDFRKSLYQGMKLKVIHTNFIDIIESNIAAFEYMARDKNIHVDFKTSERTVKGWFDVEKLDIILFNILSNAFKYTPDYGLVRLDLAIANANKNFSIRHIELRISNTGKGIPKEMQEKVFERFFQVKDKNQTTNVNTGTGIGLALVKNLVELNRGKITLTSEPGKTTTFSVFLPFNREDFDDDEIFDFKRDADRRTKELIKTVDARNEDSFYEKKDQKRKKVLVVEDNQELRDYLAGYLGSDFKVYTAKDGQEGLERCLEKSPDLVVSDVMMDNIDGVQFCRKLKSLPEISHIPVILMTAMASVENKLEGYKIGADDYITKPFEPQLLKLRVHNILNNRSKIIKDFGKNDKVSFKQLTTSKIDEDFLNKVIDLIDKNIDNANFDMESFSKNLGVSSSQLYRKIKGIAGVSPNEFIRTYRLREAAKMIEKTSLTMTEIAYKVGFNDSLYFSKCFKKQYGVSPSKYKKG